MRSLTLGGICLGGVLACASASVLRADDTALISVDAANSPGPVNRLVFGGNTEAADNARIFSSNTTSPFLLTSANGFWNPVTGAPAAAVLDRARGIGMAALRYPGGSLVHNYDWRKTVGPIETRGDWKFGVDEFISLCRTLGAEPIMTVSDYVLPTDQMPAYAAGLVEYLNSPATPDHPWAMKRKEWGHPDPYGVKYFELGNESAEGNMRVLPPRKFDPEAYAAYANATAAAMKQVDPSIKLGLVMMPGPGIDVTCAWNRTAVHEAGKSVDYLIVHLYGPDVGKNYSSADFFQAIMAVADQSGKHLDEYRALAQKELGHELPLAITEYNGPLDGDRAATRMSYGVALECADLIRIYLQPQHQVLAACYWSFLNGPPFGMVQTDKNVPDGGTTTVSPAYTLYQLWAEHLGSKLAVVNVEGPRSTFAGAGSVYAATGESYVPSRSLGEISTDGLLNAGMIKTGVTLNTGADGAFSLQLDNVTGKSYPALATLPAPQGAGACDYDVTFDARFVPAAGSDAPPMALGIGDSRGWGATRSAIEIDGIGGDWKTLHARYHALPDTTSVTLQARLEFGSAAVSGELDVRGLKIEAESTPIFPAYPLLTSCASLSDDGKTLHLVVFNKSTTQDIPARLHVAGFSATSARVWEVNSPDLSASSGVGQTVQGAPLDLTSPDPTHTFPAHSMTAIDFLAQGKPSSP